MEATLPRIPTLPLVVRQRLATSNAPLLDPPSPVPRTSKRPVESSLEVYSVSEHLVPPIMITHASPAKTKRSKLISWAPAALSRSLCLQNQVLSQTQLSKTWAFLNAKCAQKFAQLFSSTHVVLLNIRAYPLTAWSNSEAGAMLAQNPISKLMWKNLATPI